MHANISAADKDIHPVFHKLCSFVSSDVFKMAEASGITEEIYTDDEVSTLLNEDNIEILREEKWLEEIYGPISSLNYEAWKTKVADKQNNWLFNSREVRKHLFEVAQIVPRH